MLKVSLANILASDTPEPSAEHDLSLILRANFNRFLLFAIAFFTVNTLFYRVAGDPGYIPALSLFTLLTLIGFWLYNRQKASMFRLELTGYICSTLLVFNGILDIFMEYRPIKLMYLLLLLPALALTAVRLKVSLIASLITISGFLSAAWHFDRASFLDCVWVAFCGSVVGIALSTIIRSTMLKALHAKIAADLHRDQALTLATYDSLTGLANRRAFLTEVSTHLAQPQSFFLGLVDLDGFKPINDIYGHAAGDTVLTQVAERLRQTCGDTAFISRLGGDEFAIILYKPQNSADWQVCADAIVAVLSRPYQLENEMAHLSASLGSTFRAMDMEVTASRLLERADYALYEAKERGRGIAVLFDRTHEDLIRATKAVEQALRAMDGQKELTLAFQPQYDIIKGKTVAFEALARWHSDRLGVVPPDMFIRAAERSGLITGLTPILLEKALQVAQDWPTDIRLAFNLSARDILSPAAVSRIVDVVHASGFPSSRIEFEITETAMITDFSQAENGIKRLSDMGCRIALDDFGSGYTNFSHINRVKVDTVKIDRSFVLELGRNDRAMKIIKSMIELADNLDMEHVIEGVETETERLQLEAAGAVNLQGYLFSRPMPETDIAAYLAREQATTTAKL
ncbi:putative bifunctional diguanylate cyclase/phosphodiesterase [Asticcacaulis tiandongensis]|uniref:putative bifunctional diguanylate cyclase/phosphodiesterase n=1 Tax=Asticcacaulis tiandongensis TaxID=2565365 RepID=UPI0015E82D07|nr:EAL domain-containing protein [Asticcacaulis tiandongensis]